MIIRAVALLSTGGLDQKTAANNLYAWLERARIKGYYSNFQLGNDSITFAKVSGNHLTFFHHTRQDVFVNVHGGNPASLVAWCVIVELLWKCFWNYKLRSILAVSLLWQLCPAASTDGQGRMLDKLRSTTSSSCSQSPPSVWHCSCRPCALWDAYQERVERVSLLCRCHRPWMSGSSWLPLMFPCSRWTILLCWSHRTNDPLSSRELQKFWKRLALKVLVTNTAALNTVLNLLFNE